MKMKNLKIYEGFILSMRKYLSKYYNINARKVSEFSHDDLSKLTGKDYLEIKDINNEDITHGDIVLVKDTNNLVLGYTNPLTDETINYGQQGVMTEDNKIVIDISNMDEFNDYELEVLAKECKKQNKESMKNRIIKELCRRSFENFNRKEEILEKVRKRERVDFDD